MLERFQPVIDPRSPILICTLVGTPDPVISAIRALQPARNLCLATADDPERQQKGSRDQVEIVLAVAGHAPQGCETHVVPPDDPDAVFATATAALDRLAAGSPGVPVVADYTGGTKSMSA